MAANGEQTNVKTTAVSLTLTTISKGMTENAASLFATRNNTNMIAAAVEEMSGTIRNLATLSEQTSTAVKQSNQLTGEITETMKWPNLQ